jgi:carboxyl-terminal processing protease
VVHFRQDFADWELIMKRAIVLFLKIKFTAFMISIIILASLICGLSMKGADAGNTTASKPSLSTEFLQNFTETLNVIQQDYVENVGSEKLVYNSIKGMLAALDPHSNFLDPKEFAKLTEDQQSKFFGLGIHIHPLLPDHGKHVIVETPDNKSPAGRAGLRLGDVITHIEGAPIDNWTTEDVINHLRGPRGSSVSITIERPRVPAPFSLTLERDEVPMETVPFAFEVKPGIGYIKIDRFSATTAEEFSSKLKRLKNLSGLILDLRDNPGGLLNQAIEITDFFLHQGDLVVSIKGRMQSSSKEFTASADERVRIPLVVLINQMSASASEIVAGALQDHDRALIVGETSFGKGLVQSVYTLADNTGMTLTTARYYTPSGRLIQRHYSGSHYDMDSEDRSTQRSQKKAVHYTDSKRKVYGGGGITPDIIAPARALNRFEMTLASKDLFFQYGRLLINETPAIHNGAKPSSSSINPIFYASMEIPDPVIAGFKRFLRERQIDFTEKEFNANLDFIKSRIKQDTLMSSMGIKESAKIGILNDIQVLKALVMMPEAKTLMTEGHPVSSGHRLN